MNKPRYCLLCYTTKQNRRDGEMEYTVDTDCLDEAAMIVDAELAEGMYCVSIYERQPFTAPMQFLEAHIQPLAVAA